MLPSSLGKVMRGPHGGEKSIWLHHPCLLGVSMVGRNQPSKEWMRWKPAENGRKWVKLGGNLNIHQNTRFPTTIMPIVSQNMGF